MPYIKPERRKIIDEEGLNALKAYPTSWIESGDRCYFYYKQMVDKWKADPRWTTAHEIRKDMYEEGGLCLEPDDMIAEDLAWQVFFIKYVMPYEDEKEEENGTI